MDPEKKKERKALVRKMMSVLRPLFPDARIALEYGGTWELVVATILSAQCTDKKVNEVTRSLFKKYRTLDDYADADTEVFAADIRQTGFYRNKAKNIIAAARMVRDEYAGRVPGTMAELIRLPGVARKTANVVLGNAFGIHEGIAVDTHVMRLAHKFDLSDHTDPVKIERDLMEIVPKEEWFAITYALIEYGRKYSPARKKDCRGEPLEKLCPKKAAIKRGGE